MNQMSSAGSSRVMAPRRALGALLAAAVTVSLAVAGAVLPGAAATAGPNADLPYPVFRGSKQPVPDSGTAFTPGNMMRAIYRTDVKAGAGTSAGRDFWMDRMLARTGDGPTSANSDENRYLFSRGRALFMKDHDPSVLGFGGDVAYWESIDGRPAYELSMSVDGEPLTLTEVPERRRQTPSYWRSTFTTSDPALSVVQTKYITDENVAVTGFTVRNGSGRQRDVAVKAVSPYATTAEGSELTGTVRALNDLTTIYPRLSGDAMEPADGALTGTVRVPAGASRGAKVQMGFLTRELPSSQTGYRAVRQASAAAAYTAHVRAYNAWWADNIPYLDIPDKNVQKSLYYRWWLMRFNYLDANIPGNDYQFPTSVEGALGYNNAIDLTIPLFVDDLKYFRDPAYSYGPWVSAGEVAGNGKFVDNPGDPANWSTSHAQYISAAALRSYQLHGGPPAIAEKLATYAEKEVEGQLASYDKNGNGVLEQRGTAWTGNDADAVSFDYRPGSTMERPETAFTWANADASARAYRLAGDQAGAERATALATKMRSGLLSTLWDPESKDILSRITGGADDGVRVPWKEINNYDAFNVGMMPRPGDADYADDYVQALRGFGDAEQFPIFPFYTANQADKKAAAAAGRPGSNNFSVINSTGLMNTMASSLRHYPTPAITPESLKKLIWWNAYAQYQNDGDNRYPDANEFWADGSADPQKIGYRSWIHQTILGATNKTVIEDMMGLQPRSDGAVEMWPIDMGLDSFAASNIRYRDSDLSITWVKPGTASPYGRSVPTGYTIWVDGQAVTTLDRLERFTYDPDTGEVTLPKGSEAKVSNTRRSDVAAPTEVRATARSRVSDIFAKTGVDLTGSTGKQLAETAGATWSAPGSSPSATVDGSTALAPLWSTKGSPNARDSLTVRTDRTRTVDSVRTFFYSDKKPAGTREPATYTVEYWDGGQWRTVDRSTRSPAYPEANANEVRFAPVRTSQVRLTLTPAPGHSVAVKEVQVSDARGTVEPGDDLAPYVDAYPEPGAGQGGTAALTGVVKDDGTPGDGLSQRWSVVEAPEGATAVFDDPTSPSTTARFTAAGRYTLRLTATDGRSEASDDVQVTSGEPGGAANVATSATPTASYTAGWNDVRAVNDGKAATTGGNANEVWATWSGDRPASQWLQYTWASPMRVDGSRLTFWHDAQPGTGDGVAVPASWKIQYLDADGTTWKDVPGPSEYGTSQDEANETTFSSVTTTALRATFTASTGAGGNSAVGVSEWEVLADAPASIGETHVRTRTGQVPELPETVDVVYDDGSRTQAPVTWQDVQASQFGTDGATVPVTGVLTGSGTVVRGTVHVRDEPATAVTVVEPVTATTTTGRAPALPPTVTVTYNDGSRDSTIAVDWAAVDPSRYAQAGTFEVTGTVTGTPLPATATVTVRDP